MTLPNGSRGLTAYDASFVALAEAEGIKLITDDQLILSVAPAATLALSKTIRAPTLKCSLRLE